MGCRVGMGICCIIFTLKYIWLIVVVFFVGFFGLVC